MTTTEVAPVPAAPATGKPFTMLLLVEGFETSDGRMMELGTTTWRDMPIPFMVQDTTAHGPGQVPAPAWAAGQIEAITRDPADPSRILGAGHLLPNEDGQRAEDLMRHAFRGVSVDAYPSSPMPPDVQPTAVDQNGEPLAVLVRYADAVISRVTMVPTPAIAACCVWLDDEDMPQVAMDAHGGVIADDEEPEVLQVADPYEQLVASGGGPVNPPRSWFFTPEPDEYQSLEVTADGRISGHIAPEGQCHIGIVGRCQTAPMSTTVPPYKAFHRTTARCENDSEVACGWLTIGTKHENLRADADETADHYDHTGTLAAKIRLSNGRYGIWASGALLPGLDDRTLAILQGPEVSGDWRRWQDPDTRRFHQLEVLGVLAVPFPGFPGTRTRPEMLVASGQIVAQFGNVEPCDCDEGDEPMTPEERAQIEDRFAGIEKMMADMYGALVASGAITAPEPAVELVADEAEVEPDTSGETDATAQLQQQIDDAEGGETVELTLAERAIYYAKYTADQKRQLAKAGQAMPDGSFPCKDADDVKSAISAVGRGGADHDGIRRMIARNAKRLGISTPDTWQSDGSIKNAA